MSYRARGRIHDMRPSNAKTKVGKMRATNAAGAAGKASRPAKVAPEVVRPRQPQVAATQQTQAQAQARSTAKVGAMQRTQAAGKAGKAKAAERAAAAKKAGRRKIGGKLSVGIAGAADTQSKMEQQTAADSADFNNRVASMSADRKRMQTSTSGKAQSLIKRRRA